MNKSFTRIICPHFTFLLIAVAHLAYADVANPIPQTFFSMNMVNLEFNVPWPTDTKGKNVQLGLARMWDTQTTWSDIEGTKKGTYDWSVLDGLVSQASQNNVAVLYTFGATPHWASSHPSDATCNYDVSGSCWGPTKMQDWKDFVTAVAKRYTSTGVQTGCTSGDPQCHGVIKYWETWNEANQPPFWSDTVATIVTMHIDAYNIIKGIEPDATISGPSSTWATQQTDATIMKPWDWYDLAFFPELLKQGGKIDAASFHAYAGSTTPEKEITWIGNMRDVMKTHGYGGKSALWNTESSWGKSSLFDGTTDEGSAFVARYFFYNLNSNVQILAWYAWGLNLWADNTGTQQAGNALGQVCNWLGGATLSQSCTQTTQGVWNCTLTRPGGYKALAVWNSSGSLSGYNPPSGYTAYRDLAGKTTRVNGSVTLPTTTIGSKTILFEMFTGSPKIGNAYVSSMTATWTSSTGNNGYIVDASTASNFSGTLHSASTTKSSDSSLTVTGLSADTLYYLRVGALYPATTAYALTSPASKKTLTSGGSGNNPPGNPKISAVHTSTMTATWTKVTGTSGYEVDASTVSNFKGTIFSSNTTNASATTLTVNSLSSDTTYFMRVGALYGSTKVFANTVPASTSTLTNLVTGGKFSNVYASSVTVTWTSLSKSQGYRLEASVASDFTGTILSSSTTKSTVSKLTVKNLDSATKYYLRIGGINWNNVSNYVSLGSTTTKSTSTGNDPPGNPKITTVYISSATATWTKTSGANGYEVDAATTSNFKGTLISSITSSGSAVTLTVKALSSDTTYYMRVGATYGSTKVFANTSPALTSTLTQAVSNAQFKNVYTSSVAVTWTALNKSQGYRLDASLVSDFSGALLSSSTTLGTVSKLTVKNLDSGTKYYFRVGGLNWQNVANYVTLGSTKTQSDQGSNPLPSLSSITPSSTTTGGSAFTLTVNGNNFISGSVVRWNGSNRTTTFVNSSKITASISAADIVVPGAVNVTVFTLAPGGGTSNVLIFTVGLIHFTPLDSPTLALPPFLPVDATIAANYPSPAQPVSFQWTFTPLTGGGIPAPGSGAAALGSKAPASAFITPIPQASLSMVRLGLGPCLITVAAVDSNNNVSAAAQASVTLVAADLSSARIYPNPWRSDKHAGKFITFDNLTVNATVKIFTVSGHHVKTLPTSSTSATWDMTNDAGQKVASGLYVYLITNDIGLKRTGRIVVIK